MKLINILKVSLLGIILFGLAACASTGEKMGSGSESYSITPEQSYMSNSNLTTEQLLAINTYYFKFDSSELIGVNLQAVQAQGTYLSAHPDQYVFLEGNTDIRGSREYNIGLGWRRAQSVKRVLVAQGVSPANIKMISYGSENPVAHGNIEQDYALNRRVNLIYCNDAQCSDIKQG